ncbi:MAG: hypothetical protein R2692_06905 [Microbacterium sp.]
MTHTLPLPDFTHERVEVTTGPRSGLVITVALHSSALGSALGGALWTSPALERRRRRRARLSAAMTLKNARRGARRRRRQSPGHPPATRGDARRRPAPRPPLDLGDAAGVVFIAATARWRRTSVSTTDDMLTVKGTALRTSGFLIRSGGSGEPAVSTSLGVYESLRATLER